MAESEERKKFWHIFYSPLVFIVLLIVFVFMIRAMWNVYKHERVSSQDRARLESELAATNQRTAALKKQVDNLETSQGVDDEIRAKFNVMKNGEGVAVIVNSTSSGEATTTMPAVEKTWWDRLLDLLGL